MFVLGVGGLYHNPQAPGAGMMLQKSSFIAKWAYPAKMKIGPSSGKVPVQDSNRGNEVDKLSNRPDSNAVPPNRPANIAATVRD